MDLGSLFVSIRADTAPFNRAMVGVRGELVQTDAALQGTAGLGASLFAQLGGGAGMALGGIAAITGAVSLIGVGLYKCVSAASSLNESLNKSSVVFGPASGEIVAAAEEMAARFGISKREFVDAAANIGLVGQAAGMTQEASANLGVEMAKLAVDASSFSDVPFDVALEKIRSGLVGESEPLRAFGVIINETQVKAEALRMGLESALAGGNLSESDKVLARISLIRSGLEKQSGDMERTSDSVANLARQFSGRFENMTADIGTGLLPIAQALLKEINSGMSGLTTAIANNKDAIRDWASVMASDISAIGAVIRPIVGFLANMAEEASLASQALGEMAQALANPAHALEVNWGALNPLHAFDPTGPQEEIDRKLQVQRDRIAQQEKKRRKDEQDQAQEDARRLSVFQDVWSPEKAQQAMERLGITMPLIGGPTLGILRPEPSTTGAPTEKPDVMGELKELLGVTATPTQGPIGVVRGEEEVPPASVKKLKKAIFTPEEGELGVEKTRRLPTKEGEMAAAAPRTEGFEAFSQRLQEAVFGKGDTAKQQLDEQKKSNDHLNKLVSAATAKAAVPTAAYAS